jgi:hypothetical protein
MSASGRAATRYEAAKLYLIGKYAAQLVDVARGVLATPQAVSRHVEAMYDAQSGCASLLHHIGQLAAGVLPWEVVQGLNTAYADLAAHVDSPNGTAVLADAARVIACVDWLEGQIVPDWNVRAKT